MYKLFALGKLVARVILLDTLLVFIKSGNDMGEFRVLMTVNNFVKFLNALLIRQVNILFE